VTKPQAITVKLATHMTSSPASMDSGTHSMERDHQLKNPKLSALEPDQDKHREQLEMQLERNRMLVNNVRAYKELLAK
jgi:hypothetical protein